MLLAHQFNSSKEDDCDGDDDVGNSGYDDANDDDGDGYKAEGTEGLAELG